MRLPEPQKKYGRLTALRPNETINFHWWFSCDCGTVKGIRKYGVLDGSTKSCGCRKGLHIHGMNGSKEHTSWRKMLGRCYNQNNTNYKNYGARGVTVCDRWKDSFQNFYNDMGPAPSSKHSIDRIDVSGNYESSNCRWATRLEQNRNKRNTKLTEDSVRLIRAMAGTASHESIAKQFGVSPSHVCGIINHRKWRVA